MQALADLCEWKDAVITVQALPTNVLTRLCMVCSKIVRTKSILHTELKELLGITRGLTKGILLDNEVQRHRQVAF